MSDRTNDERMNIWDESWDLHVQACPCDVHFLELLENYNVRGASIFHFGEFSIPQAKIYMAAAGLPMRLDGLEAAG